jgi:hypothetical protein
VFLIVAILYLKFIIWLSGEYSDTSIMPLKISKERIINELHQKYMSSIPLKTVAFIQE